jgi:formate hydrogenlyase transcriptional activator
MIPVATPRTDIEPAYERLFELAPDAMLLIDPFADVTLSANAAARRLLALEAAGSALPAPSRLLGGNLAELIAFTQAVLEKGAGWSNRLRLRSLDDRQHDVECQATRVSVDAGPGMLASIRHTADVRRRYAVADADEFVRRGLSEWRRVEQLFAELEQENRLILEAAGEGVYGIGRDGRTTFVNPAAARMLGYSAEELIGRDAHGLIHHTRPDGSPYPAGDCPIYAAFRDGAVHQEDDELFWRKDGTAFPVSYTSTPIRQGGHLVGAVIVFRDVTERKESEQRLRQALDELEDLRRRLEQENAYLQEELRDEHDYREIVGRSRVLRETIRKIELVAPTDAVVLITGESGTGKELIARAIHQSSQRAERPLIRVNCAAVPAELFESEFFGHVRGAFTGALRDRAGRFELASGGTLFLDEVGEIPLELQSKLLRVLQEGQFERVGGDRTQTTDVRVIAATNRELQADVAAGRFREDLYFRLNVFPIHSAALRERKEDIPLLVAHFLHGLGRRFGRENLRISEADVQRLQAYDWPGNIRELQNLLERAVIVSPGGQLRVEVPEAPGATGPTTAPGSSETASTGIITEHERRARDRAMIEKALQRSGGKVFGPGGAAEILGIKPTTLASRIKRWGIETPRR